MKLALMVATAVFMLLAQAVCAEPLDDALGLVMEVNPVVMSHEAMLRTTANTKPWESKVRIGYVAKETLDSAEGWNAALTVSIPLFDNTRDRETIQARQRLAQAEDTLLGAFLDAVRQLVTLNAQAHAAVELLELHKDRLTYQKQAQEQGLLAPAELWPPAETAKRSEHVARQAIDDYNTLLETTARRFGANRWRDLKMLLVAHVQPVAPTDSAQ